MEKILVIDDEKPFRLVVMAALQRQGYEVMGAGDGTEGLAQTFAAAPSLVLTDVNMAGQSGFDFLRQLRAHPQTAAIPVIIMTGETHKADARFSMHQGADDFLQKPFAMEEMLATVAARLQRRAGINLAVEAQHAAEMMSAAENLRLQTSALDAAANGIAITHRTGKILWVNPAFTKLTGYAAEEAIGRNPRFLNSGRHAPEFFADLWATINAGKVWHGELINRRKDGTTYFEEMTITPVRDAGGQIQNFIAIKQDVSGRKQIEKELAQERDLLQALMDHQPDHIYFKDLNSRFTRINRALAEHLGVATPAAAIGKSDAQFFSIREARQKLVDERRLLATGKPILGLVEKSDTATGKKWVSSTKVPIYNPSGEIAGLVGISHDITERKQAEEALQQKQAELRVLFDLMPAMIWFKDTGNKILRVNQRVADALGKPIEAIEGRSFEEIYPETAAGFYADDLEVIRAGVPRLGVVAAVRNPAGKAMWLQTDKVPVCDKYGKVIGIVVMAQDITERKLFEVQMERLRHEHAAVLNSLGEGVHWIDVNGIIKFENPAAANMLGYDVAELVGKPAHVTMHHSRADGTVYPQQECHIYATLRDGVGRRVTDEVFWRKDGTSFAVDYICTPVNEPDGSSAGSVVIFTDITERKRLEAQLVQAQKLETVGQLASGIAHEINTPTQYVGDNTRFVKDSFGNILKVLQSHQELLAAARQQAITPELLARQEAILASSDLEYLCQQIPAALAETLEGVERVSKIVRAMKEFSHPGGKEKTAADLNKAIQSTVTVTHNEWKYVADLNLELDPELPLVPCFLGEFNQSVLNLIINAAHAIGDVVGKNPGTKGCITVKSRRDGEFVEVRVADTGTGIPEAARPKIFEPFFTTKGVGKGTGQGLSIVYGSIVKRHGGTVTFETETGRGTTFIIRLPLKFKAAAGTNPVPAPPCPDA